MDSATRIDIYANAPEPERVGPEKPPEMIAKEEEEAWDRAMNAQNPQRSANFAKFARILAEAAVKQGAVEVPRGDRLQVVYTIATLRMEAMRIPSNLSERLVRIYQYDFNYQRCASYVRPINLLYCEVRGRGAYASIDQYDPADDHKVGIVLEYES
ncbi:MAG: hypothetical protein GC165_03780 [Armatimonadetes bacterium]|nr:hypothetical protein [Armatimonadota bacterium]